MESKHHYNLNFLIGLVLGGLLGGVTIFVLGTKEGKKFAEKLIEKAELYEEELEKKLTLFETKGEKIITDLSASQNPVIKELKEVKKNSSSGKLILPKNITSDIGQTLTNLEKIQRKGVFLTASVRKRFFKKDGKKLQA